MNFDGVIFDLDGTLIDSMGIWRDVDIEYLEKRGIDVTPDLFTDIPEGNSFSELAQYVKDRFLLPDSIETICAEWTAMVKDHYENHISLRPGVLDLIEYLTINNIPMAVGTSNSQELTEAVLKSNKIYDHFKVIISGDTHLRGKPFPDIFCEAARGLGIKENKIIVIEDTLVGVRSARNAGMMVIAIKDDDSIKDWDKILHEADHVVNNFAEILLYLQGSKRRVL